MLGNVFSWNFEERIAVRHLNILIKLDVKDFMQLYSSWDFSKSGTKHYMEINGSLWSINMDSQRYQVFSKSTQCVTCKRNGEHFLLQHEKENQKSAHFNLYGLGIFGEDILFTKDHILPRSKGGKDILENYQTMCYICNKAKGNTTSVD